MHYSDAYIKWGVVLSTFLNPLPLACSLLGTPCQVKAVFLSWRLLLSLRLCIEACVVLAIMPYTVLWQPSLLGLSAALTITS